MIYKHGYNNKFFVPFQYVQPLFQFLHSLLDLLLWITPYRSDVEGWYLRKLLTKQMQKRIAQRKTKQDA